MVRSSGVLLGLVVLVCGCRLGTTARSDDSDPDPDEGCKSDPPYVGDEHAFDDPIIATIGANALDPAVAFDGTNYLVVWTDWRTDGAMSDVWAARVDSLGHVLDATSFPIAAAPGVQAHPAVAFDGTRYIVAWEDYKVFGGTDADLAVAAVSTDGVVTPLPSLAATAASETRPALARTPTGGVVAAWIANDQIEAGFIEGGPAGPIAVTASAQPSSEPAIGAAASGDILIAYSQESATTKTDTYGQLLTAAGAVSGAPIAISTGVSRTTAPAISFDGTNFIVAFVGYTTGVDIYGARVTTAGAVLDSHLEGGELVGGRVIVHATDYQQSPSVSCGAVAGECEIAWQDTRNLPVPTGLDIYAIRVASSTLAPLGAETLISNAPHSQTSPRIAASPTGYFTVWQDARGGGDGQLRATGARIAADGSNQDPAGIVVDTGYNFQRYPSIATTSAGSFVSWNDSRSLDGDDIMFAQLDGAASMVSLATVSASPYTQQDSAVVAVGDDLLFAWRDQRGGVGSDIRVARFSGGSLLDPDGLVISGTSGPWIHPSAASSGTESLVVYVDARTLESYGAIVHPDGTSSAPFPVATGTPENIYPSVAWDDVDGVYVVAWQSGAAGATTDIRATRVTPAGQVLDPGGVVLATGTERRTGAHVAFVDGVGLLVFQANDGTTWHVLATRFTAGAGLAVTDPTPAQLTAQTTAQSGAAVTRLGGDFFVSWTDSSDPEDMNVWGTRVPSTGTIEDTAFAIASSPVQEDSSAVSGLDDAHLVIAYTVHRADVDAKRVVTRVLDVPAACKKE